LKNEGLIFVLTKSEFMITFDKIIKTSHGHVNGIELIPVVNMVNLTFRAWYIMDINEYHQSMGHVHEDSLRKMAEYYGLKL
jgi:ribosome-binding ATPase YchF (GTP1/OBG family)